jgi:hypothetical protein
MKNVVRQAKRGTLRILDGVNTRRVVARFFEHHRIEKLLESSALIRMKNREFGSCDERLLFILLAATKTGELKKEGPAWWFRGFSFMTLRADVPMGIFRRFTEDEVREMGIPTP